MQLLLTQPDDVIINYMLAQVSPDDIARLPHSHRECVEHVFESLRNGRLPDELMLMKSSHAHKDGLTPSDYCILAFAHSWRGDNDTGALLEASYWLSEYNRIKGGK